MHRSPIPRFAASRLVAPRPSASRRGARIPYALLALALLLALPLADAGSRVPELTREAKGKQIYEKGTSPSGKDIVAVVAGADVPGSALPCGSCHGADGKGRPEGGVRPANVTWEGLTTELAESRANGRRRPAYDERKVKRAITMGLDPRGEQLHAAMPRYRMSAEDMTNLIAYLKVLGRTREAGVTDTTIDVGIARGRSDARAEEVEAVVGAYFEEINERGGIYNRRIELRAMMPGGTSGAEHFAILCGTSEESCDSMLAAASGEGMPVIGTRSLFAPERSGMGGDLFYLYPEVTAEVTALATYARQRLAEGASGVIVRPAEGRWRAPVAAAIARCRAEGWSGLREIELAADADADVVALVTGLKREGVGVVIALGPSRAANGLLEEIARQEWRPFVLMPGELGENDPLDIPSALDGSIYLSYPSWLQSITPGGMESYTRLRERGRFGSRHLRGQLSALAGAMIFVEGLKRTGRDLTRERLVAQLERLNEFETGLIPPVTYGPNRRTGTDDLYIVAVGTGARSSNLVGRYSATR
jgi:ABC-type branched-subunit amino acid transport system substrate-binding protein/cytochrome c553